MEKSMPYQLERIVQEREMLFKVAAALGVWRNDYVRVTNEKEMLSLTIDGHYMS